MKEWFINDGLILIVAILTILGGTEYIGWQCNNYGEVTGRDTKYISFDACYIKVEDEWVRYDSAYRRIENVKVD